MNSDWTPEIERAEEKIAVSTDRNRNRIIALDLARLLIMTEVEDNEQKHRVLSVIEKALFGLVGS